MAMRWIAVLASVAGLGLVAPAAASGAGGPVPPVQGGSTISVPGSPFRYVDRGAPGHATVLIRRTRGGGPSTTLRLQGSWGIPAVTYNGTLTGLSADGGTLVLAQISKYIPARTTHLAVIDARRMTVRERITLHGFSVVDAISPDGRWLYLIRYRSAAVFRYDVLAYDLRAGRLLTTPIVDRREPDEKMTGIALSRVMSPGGRWSYTLYVRPSNGTSFIHALDTVQRRAFCVDLPEVSAENASSVTLGPGSTPAAGLRVVLGGITLATVNTRTFAVTRPGAVSVAGAAEAGGAGAGAAGSGAAGTGAAAATASRSATHGSSGAAAGAGGAGAGGADSVPWGLIALTLLTLAALGGLGVAAVRTTRRTSAD
jgi:hypothetical protein